jgi:ATP-dependent helicase/nuclease subunit A
MLSDAQRAAVEHGPRDACVTAGAGSGKTRVLAERFVHLVQTHGLRVRDIAALTFTEKAAAEMRERIARYFEAAGNHRAHAEVEFAPISTIHAFCARLLRLHAVEAGVDPAFQVLQAGDARLLQEDAILLAEAELAARDDAALGIAAFLPAGDPRPFIRLVLDAVRGSGLAADALRWESVADAAPLVADVREALEVLEPFFVGATDAARVQVEDALSLVDVVLSGGLSGADQVFAAFQAAARVDALKSIKGKGYASARNAARDALSALAGAYLDAFGRDTVLPHLRTWLASVDEHYTQRKRERSALDFTDLERESLRLLERLHAKGRDADLAPRALLVDEYQDTNPLQARILSHLRRSAPQFAVGDPKQSIYRFRRADVGVILEERAAVEEDGRFELSTSYRAHPALVDRLNAIQAAVFEHTAAGVPYEALEAGGRFDGKIEAPLRMCIHKSDTLTADELRPREARWLAEEIQRLVGSGARLTKEGAGGRPVRYGDIAMLFRARTSVGIYEDALAAAGVPYLTLKGQGFLGASEIEDLIHVLRVLQNPEDEFALGCVATGPAMGADDAALLRWFGHRDESAWARMGQSGPEDGPYAAAAQRLRQLRRVVLEGHPAEALEGALKSLGLLEVALLQEQGSRRAANLRKAVTLAHELQARGERDLGDLLRYLTTLRDLDVGESEAAIGGEDADVVRLGTVHGAKGLEYPVVFLADAGRATPPITSSFFHDGEGALAFKLRDPLEGSAHEGLAFARLRAREVRAAAEESLRLFYVAATRAEERLYVSAIAKGLTAKGVPHAFFGGWARGVFEAAALDFEPGTVEATIGGVSFPVEIRDVTEEALASVETEGGHDSLTRPESTADEAAAARALAHGWVTALDRDLAPLGSTRFVVSVSELLLFARSPVEWYTQRVLLDDPHADGHGVAEAPGHDGEDPFALDGEADESRRLAERRAEWDELPEADARASRAALGSAAHAVIESLGRGDPSPDLVGVLRGTTGLPPTEEDVQSLAALIERFQRSDLGRQVLQPGGELVVRQEVDFHARIRFPGGEPVGGFSSLLVKGSIDLWLETDGELVLVDHKTNRRSALLPTPEAVAEHYAWQLRLYALAVERLRDRPVTRASLLLLDPSWGEEALEVAIDISGEALRETRRLCRAFALAELEGRYLPDWREYAAAPVPS